MKKGLGLFFNGKEIKYKGYEKVQLVDSDFTRVYKGVRKNKMEISFPIAYESKEIYVDEVILVNMFGTKLSFKLEKPVIILYNSQPVFAKGELKLTLN